MTCETVRDGAQEKEEGGAAEGYFAYSLANLLGCFKGFRRYYTRLRRMREEEASSQVSRF